MQTFLPFSNYQKSALYLDSKRLNKQIVEVHTILNTLLGKSEGWRNHPAVLMWKGYEFELSVYGIDCYREYRDRFDKTHKSGIEIEKINYELYNEFMSIEQVRPQNRIPPWLGDERFHTSHRSNLLRKDPEWYGQWGWTEPDNLPYFWPVKKDV